jgi:hypothetical protein
MPVFPGEGKPAQKNKNKNKNRKGNQPEEKKMKEPRDSKQNAKKKNQAAGKKRVNAQKRHVQEKPVSIVLSCCKLEVLGAIACFLPEMRVAEF